MSSRRHQEPGPRDAHDPLAVAPASYTTADSVVAGLLAHQDTVGQDVALGSGHLDSTEVVVVAEGGMWLGQVTVPGVCMTWHQGSYPYGLLMPLHRLREHGGGDIASMVFYLRLAVDEPHDRTAEGARCWFFDLPSGSY